KRRRFKRSAAFIAAAVVMIALPLIYFTLIPRGPLTAGTGSNAGDGVQGRSESAVPKLPENYQKASDDLFTDQKAGKKFYQRIARRLPGTDKPVEFILIPRTGPRNDNDPETYYIMENKVSVGLFRDFAARHSLAWKPPSRGADDRFPA